MFQKKNIELKLSNQKTKILKPKALPDEDEMCVKSAISTFNANREKFPKFLQSSSPPIENLEMKEDGPGVLSSIELERQKNELIFLKAKNDLKKCDNVLK